MSGLTLHVYAPFILYQKKIITFVVSIIITKKGEKEEKEVGGERRRERK